MASALWIGRFILIDNRGLIASCGDNADLFYYDYSNATNDYTY